MTADRGDWIQTYTGGAWWPMDPRPEDVHIDDIAHSLALQCRFNGHCSAHYSIAQHSLLVGDEMERRAHRAGESRSFQRRAAIAGMLHDAAEAYLGDIVRPLKGQLAGFKELEEKNLRAIHEAIGLPAAELAELADEIRRVDLILLATECRDLMLDPPIPWGSIEGIEPLPTKISPWPADMIESTFRRHFAATHGFYLDYCP